MEVQKGIPIANRKPQELIETMQNCLLCGSPLRFNHVTDFKRHHVLEEGQCPVCGIKNRVSEHVLQ